MSENLEVRTNVIVLTLPSFHLGCLYFEFEAHVLLLYKLFLLRCFCGLYDLNSLSFFFFLQTQAFTLEP